jgi:hypothetical protein
VLSIARPIVPRAIEILDVTVRRIERGELTAIEGHRCAAR